MDWADKEQLLFKNGSFDKWYNHQDKHELYKMWFQLESEMNYDYWVENLFLEWHRENYPEEWGSD